MLANSRLKLVRDTCSLSARYFRFCSSANKIKTTRSSVFIGQCVQWHSTLRSFYPSVVRDCRFMSSASDSDREAAILSKLKVIIDPDLHQDIVSLGFVKDLKIDGSTVSFCLELTTPACPVREEFRSSAEAAVRSLDWVQSVNVTLSSSKKKRQSSPADEKSPAGLNPRELQRTTRTIHELFESPAFSHSRSQVSLQPPP
jgi:metal-sulfur cluster biosynthetic enzyme